MSVRKPFAMRKNKIGELTEGILPKRPCLPQQLANARPRYWLMEWRRLRACARDWRAMPGYIVDKSRPVRVRKWRKRGKLTVFEYSNKSSHLTDREVAILRTMRGDGVKAKPLFEPLLAGRTALESLMYRESPFPESIIKRAVKLSHRTQALERQKTGGTVDARISFYAAWRKGLRTIPATIHFEAAMTVYAVDRVEGEMMEEGELSPIQRAKWNDGVEEVRRFYEYSDSFWAWAMYLQKHIYPVKAGAALATKRQRLRRNSELDCWLLLVWPIARKYCWTFADVEIARRMRFDSPPKKLLFSSPEMDAWEVRQINVNRAARRRMKDRCKALGLVARTATGRPRGARVLPLMANLACGIAPELSWLLP